MSLCPVCRLQQSTPFLRKGDYKIVQCGACHMLYVDPPPSSAQLAAFYNRPEYYQNSNVGYIDYLAEEKKLRREAGMRLSTIEAFMPTKGKLLDLGCAAAFFLDEAQKRGWQVAGSELSAQMRQFAETNFGLSITSHYNDLPDASFDVVTMWEYIEHLSDPRQELENLHRLLKPGGIVGISTPNTAHLQVKREPNQWWEFKPPAHLTFFTPETLHTLVRQSGYEILKSTLHLPVLPVSGGLWFQFLQQLLRITGDRLNKKTPIWWLYSTWRNLSLKVGAVVLPKDKLCVGITLYARQIS